MKWDETNRLLKSYSLKTGRQSPVLVRGPAVEKHCYSVCGDNED